MMFEPLRSLIKRRTKAVLSLGMAVINLFLPPEIPLAAASTQIDARFSSHQLWQMRTENWLSWGILILVVSCAIFHVVWMYRLRRQREQIGRRERALRESEARLHTVVENMPIMMDAFDENGYIIIWNRECEHVTGYSAKEIVGNPEAMSLLYPDDTYRQGMIARWHERGNEYYNWEWNLSAKDGTTKTVAWSNISDRFPIPGWAAWGVGVDVTGYGKTEEALRQSEERFRNLAQGAILGIMVHRETKPLFVNPAFAAILGYESPDEILALPSVVSLIAPHDRERLLTYHNARTKEEAAPTHYEYEAVCKDGSVVTLQQTVTVLNWDGQPAVMGMMMDITEHKRAEEQLRRSQKLLKTIADNFPRSYLSVINRDLTIGFTAGQEFKNRQLDPDSFVGLHLTDVFGLYGEEILNQVTQAYLKTFAGEEQSFELLLGNEHQSITTVPLPDEQGSIERILAVVQDVTEHKTLEAQLLQAQKMEAIGRLAGGIAHDFNNILVPIISYAELGMMRVLPDSKVYTSFEGIIKAANRAAEIVHQILAFSRKQMLEMQMLDLNGVIKDFEKMMRRLIGEDIELEIVLVPGLHSVKADRTQIQQVLMNLVVNARDAMPKGGKLTIETANTYLGKAHIKNYGDDLAPGPYAVMEICDTGQGMDAETQQQIFEPFFTTKEANKGTGLGLATVFGIIKQHQGNISVHSEPGRGTTFKIYLPQENNVAQIADTKMATTASLYGTETVLVVEDEEIVRKLVCETLATYGYDVLEAQSPADGLRIAVGHRNQIHLLLTDVIMPEMSGAELYQKVAANLPDIKVLYMSGYAGDMVVPHGILDEGINFLQKPFMRHTLAQKVRNVLDWEV